MSMTLLSRELCDRGAVELLPGHVEGVLDMARLGTTGRGEGVPVCDEYHRDLQRLILARLTSIMRQL